MNIRKMIDLIYLCLYKQNKVCNLNCLWSRFLKRKNEVFQFSEKYYLLIFFLFKNYNILTSKIFKSIIMKSILGRRDLWIRKIF